ncbi:hypothetical protein MRB53_041361 [Persea americana]|nr:hypothetical protein MRB53_041361 [Persea americana]
MDALAAQVTLMTENLRRMEDIARGHEQSLSGLQDRHEAMTAELTAARAENARTTKLNEILQSRASTLDEKLKAMTSARDVLATGLKTMREGHSRVDLASLSLLEQQYQTASTAAVRSNVEARGARGAARRAESPSKSACCRAATTIRSSVLVPRKVLTQQSQASTTGRPATYPGAFRGDQAAERQRKSPGCADEHASDECPGARRWPGISGSTGKSCGQSSIESCSRDEADGEQSPYTCVTSSRLVVLNMN